VNVIEIATGIEANSVLRCAGRGWLLMKWVDIFMFGKPEVGRQRYVADLRAVLLYLSRVKGGM
jgi:hypothetical protein